MNTKKFLLLMLIFIPFLMDGQTYYEDGMQWRIRKSSDYGESWTTVTTLEKTTDDNCFNVNCYNEENKADEYFAGIIKSEESKVYFKPDGSDEWYLIYDFGLKPGEGCYAYFLASYRYGNPPRAHYMKCAGIDNSGELPLLEMEEYNDDSCPYLLGKGYWIKGLSSLNGFLYNAYFEADGGGSALIDISHNGKTIYLNKTVGVTEITDSSAADIKVTGSDIYISAANDVCGSIYSYAGALIGNYRFSKTPTHIRLADSGVYILKIGNNSEKIVIR